MSVKLYLAKTATILVSGLIASTVPLASALAQQAEAGGPSLMDTFANGRATLGIVIGFGTGFTMLMLWLATWLAKRRARKSIAAYDQQLAAFSRNLRRNG
jgi:hypothetical protein